MKLPVFIFIFLISISLVSALDGFGIDDPNLPKLNKDPFEVDWEDAIASANWSIVINYSSISHNLLHNLAWSIAGHTFDTDLDIGAYDFYATNIFASNNASINNNLDVGGDITINGNLNLSGTNITDVDWINSTNAEIGIGLFGEVYINQTDDSKALTITGFDDRADQTLKLHLASTGRSQIIATDRVQIRGTQIDYFASAGKTTWSGAVTLDGVQLILSDPNDETKLTLQDDLGNQLVLTNYANRDSDHDHAVQTNPTLFIHSDTDPDTDPNQWLGLSHNATTGLITSGKGEINLAGNVTIGNWINSKNTEITNAYITNLYDEAGEGYAKYNFSTNDFNGSGDVKTTGTMNATIGFFGENPFFNAAHGYVLSTDGKVIISDLDAPAIGTLLDVRGSSTGYIRGGINNIGTGDVSWAWVLSDSTKWSMAVDRDDGVSGQNHDTSFVIGQSATPGVNTAFRLSYNTRYGFFPNRLRVGSEIAPTEAFSLTGNMDIPDNNKILFGTGKDTSDYFNASDRISNAEVGTPNYFWTNFLKYIFDSDVEISGDLNVTGNFTGDHYYSEMWFFNDTANGRTTSIAVQDTWYNVTGFEQATKSGQDLNGFSYSSGVLTTIIAGKYKGDYSISFSNSGNNVEYKTAIAVNDVIQNNTLTHRKIGAAGDVGNTGGKGKISLDVDDKITLMILNDDGTQDMGTHAANLNLLRIGD